MAQKWHQGENSHLFLMIQCDCSIVLKWLLMVTGSFAMIQCDICNCSGFIMGSYHTVDGQATLQQLVTLGNNGTV